MAPAQTGKSAAASRGGSGGGGGGSDFSFHGDGWGMDGAAWMEAYQHDFQLLLMRTVNGQRFPAGRESAELRKLGVAVSFSSAVRSARTP